MTLCDASPLVALIDRPMDMADASLVAAAETRGLNRIFTLDGDCYIYRYRDTGIFDVVPGPN